MLCRLNPAVGNVDELEVCGSCFDKFDSHVLLYCAQCQEAGWVEKSRANVPKIAQKHGMSEDDVLFSKMRITVSACPNCFQGCARHRAAN